MDNSADFIEMFGDAYERYSDAIYRHCFHKMSDSAEAEDIMQEVFVRLWEYVNDGKTIENMQSFLYTVTNNLIVDQQRKKNRAPFVSLDDLQEKGFDPGKEDYQKVRQKLDVWAMLLKKKRQRDYKLLVMRYIDGMQPIDIASVLGIPTSIISVRLHRALKMLGSVFIRRKRSAIEKPEQVFVQNMPAHQTAHQQNVAISIDVRSQVTDINELNSDI